MAQYLCYDVRGVQSFIFAVPKLRYIVGGSALVDQFDRETVTALAEQVEGVELVAAGGGRGMFRCDDAAALDAFIPDLVAKAHAEGFDLWIGKGAGFQAAGPAAEASHAFLPQDDGRFPCALSGLYPTQHEGQPHRLLERRKDVSDRLEKAVADRLGPRIDVDAKLAPLKGLRLRFPRNVSEEEEASKAASAAFGPSGRWALLAMDGNEIGRQHSLASGWVATDPDRYARWLTAMSRALDECTWAAFMKALEALLSDWLVSEEDWNPAVVNGEIYLPIRPLVLGGDDLVTLIHPRFAENFARRLAEEFAQITARANDQSEFDLWPATGGRLSISAGILYVKRTYPLHAAVGYAESLLSSAKRAFRNSGVAGGPPPAALDWEHVTDGLIDSPSARRARDQKFLDGDLGGTEVSLTARPWTFDSFARVSKEITDIIAEEQVPRSVLRGMAEHMRTGYWGRFAHRSRLGRRFPGLAASLMESLDADGDYGCGWSSASDGAGSGVRPQLVLLDVISLMEEARREQAAREVAL